jgi:hypothetical protein
MIVLYPAVLLSAAFVVLQRRRMPSVGGAGWGWFAGWCVAGATFTFSFLTGFSIGLFVLPLAAVLLIWVAWSAPRLAEALGFIEGTGLILLLVAFRQRDYAPCTGEDYVIPPGSPPGTSVGCGGFDPMPWLIAGIALTGLSLLTYLILRKE